MLGRRPIVLWTDGISDRRGDGELFGEERLRELLVAHADRTPARSQTHRVGRVDFSQTPAQDDIAIVVLRVRPAQHAAPLAAPPPLKSFVRSRARRWPSTPSSWA